MSAAPHPFAEALAHARIERQLELLGALAEIGLEVARAVERRARDAGPQEDVNALAMAYARVARAVRLTVMLQSKAVEALKGLDIRAEIAAVSEGARHRAWLADPAYAHKSRVENIVARVARACGADDDRLDRLMREAGERLDDDDIYGEILSRPVGELVALICRDLDLSPDWSRLAEEAWAQAEIQSGADGSPFIGGTPPPPPRPGAGSAIEAPPPLNSGP